MPRVKRGVIHSKSRRTLLKKTKGYMWGRKSKVRLAHTAVMKAGTNAFNDRRKNKGMKRNLWSIKINAAARANGTKYSSLINDMKKANIVIDRKILAALAQHHPAIFKKVLAAVK